MSAATFLVAAFDSQSTNFAAVFQGLDSHQLRVVPVTQSSTKVSPQEFVFEKGVKISALQWATYSADKSAQAKKRKKVTEPTGDSISVVVLGTTQGTLLLYSPAHNSILATLKTGSSSPVCSLSLASARGKIHALQNNGTLTEFDLQRNATISSFAVSVSDPSAMCSDTDLIVANNLPHFVKMNNGDVDITYTGFATQIRQLLPLGKSHFAALADEDRQVLVYQRDQPKPVHSLICPSTNAVHLSSPADLSVMAVTTEDGQVHIFESPIAPPASNKATTKSKKSKPVPQSSPKFRIEVEVAKRHTPLVVSQTTFVDNSLKLVWPEQGSIPILDSVNWRDEHGNTLSSDIKLTKQPSAPLAREHLVGGVDPAAASRYEEQSTRVVSGNHVAELEEDLTGVGEDDGETLADRLEALEVEMDKRDSNGRRHDPHHSKIIDRSLEADDQDMDETFGELTTGGDPHSALAKGSSGDNSSQSRLRRKELKLKLSQPGSFATLLNQALTLNDKQLLEICLEEQDTAMIKTSIVKLESSLAADLLEHLASTMARSQNRSTIIMQWIRWVIVIHGAYLITLPNLLKTLAALHSTLSSRASTLPRLLALQGRLELLEEQLTVRGEVAAAAAEDEDADEPEAYYDEEKTLIVNGEEANDDLVDGEDFTGSSEDDQIDSNSVMDEDEIMLSE